MVVRGHVSLVIAESVTNERMWMKSIELSPKKLPWQSSKSYKEMYEMPIEYFLEQESTPYNIAAKTLDQYYLEIMQKTWDYLDPEEMLVLKKQAQEVREKKIY